MDAAEVLGSIRGSIARPVVENEHHAASPEKILRPQYHRTHHRGTEAASARDFGREPQRPHSEYFAAELTPIFWRSLSAIDHTQHDRVIIDRRTFRTPPEGSPQAVLQSLFGAIRTACSNQMRTAPLETDPSPADDSHLSMSGPTGTVHHLIEAVVG